MGEHSEALMSITFLALDHATGSITGRGPLVPFLLVEADDGHRQISRFPGDLEEGQRHARAQARSTTGLLRAAVAWDGYLTVEGTRTDAVLVEASEVGDPESVLLAQRCEVTGRIRKRVEPLGNPAFLPRGDSLFLRRGDRIRNGPAPARRRADVGRASGRDRHLHDSLGRFPYWPGHGRSPVLDLQAATAGS